MNFLQEWRSIDRGERAVRSFARTIGGALVALALLFFVFGKAYALGVLVCGFLVALGMFAPNVVRPLYLAWMMLSVVLGTIVSKVILVIFYFGAIVPTAVAARIFKKRFLATEGDPRARSYWVRREQMPDRPERAERQY
jgi:hypothetical protein